MGHTQSTAHAKTGIEWAADSTASSYDRQNYFLGTGMSRSGRRKNEAVESVLDEAEKNLHAAFQKSSKTAHSGLKGDGRSEYVIDFLEERLPKAYGFAHKGEAVDYLDSRSGEIDIAIFDKLRNALLSDSPIWLPVESLLSVIEVKSILTEEELKKAYLASKRISSLRPFKRHFTLAHRDTDNARAEPLGAQSSSEPLRCFRTIFAYGTNLTEDNWLTREWERVQKVTRENDCDAALIDRILVLNRGMLTPPARQGGEDTEFLSVFHQWFIGLANFLSRENGRRPPVDWQTYHKKRIPGWRKL